MKMRHRRARTAQQAFINCVVRHTIRRIDERLANIVADAFIKSGQQRLLALLGPYMVTQP